jgi:addiction module RelE/StbE family toxin
MSVKLVYTSHFLKNSQKLPRAQQLKLSRLLGILQDNPFAPQLHTKPLAGQLTGFYSFRITRDWRVLFQFLEPTLIKIVDVAHRRDIYR